MLFCLLLSHCYYFSCLLSGSIDHTRCKDFNIEMIGFWEYDFKLASRVLNMLGKITKANHGNNKTGSEE